jgi:hypothetical protein
MNDGFLVGVLYSLAHLDEQIQPISNRQFLAIAVLGDGKTIHVLHHEVGLTRWRRAGVEDLRDRRMIHDGEGLPLSLKSLHDRGIAHSGFDQLQRDPATHWLRLLRQPHLSHSPDA